MTTELTTEQRNEFRQQTLDELVRVNQWTSTYLGIQGLWKGQIVLFPKTIRFFGTKDFDCNIGVNMVLYKDPLRWATLLHEILHSYSEGYNEESYEAFPGWEEGVVEGLQRELRPLMLPQIIMGGQQTEDIIRRSQIDATHPYNPYVYSYYGIYWLLKQQRHDLSGHNSGIFSIVTFFKTLLRIPLSDRRQRVFTAIEKACFSENDLKMIGFNLMRILDDPSIIRR